VTVVDFLKEAGLYRGVHDNPMRLGISSRSKDVIEPLLKPQWWVACGDMAARSCAAVRSGELEIIPKVSEQQPGGCYLFARLHCCCAGAESRVSSVVFAGEALRLAHIVLLYPMGSLQHHSSSYQPLFSSFACAGV
jgi:hypothetical protein